MLRFQTVKRLAALSLVAVLTLPRAPLMGESATLDLSGVRLIVNGSELSDLPMSPVLYNDYTLVPAREVFENMGAIVDWKADSGQVYVGYSKRLLVMEIDKDSAVIDGVSLPMTVAPKIINGKTMIPLRFVSEAFGFDVGWDSAARVASVSFNAPAQTDEAPTLDLAVLERLVNDGADGTQSAPAATPTPATTAAPAAQPQTTAAPAPQTQSGADMPAVDLSEGNIPVVEAPTTDVTALDIPADGASRFTIKSSSAISKVEKSLLPDNRLVLDIHNANMSLPKTEYDVANGGVRKIRAAQFQSEPVKITRVVFELAGGTEFRVSLSEDRTALTVDLERNAVTSAAFNTDGTCDYLTLQFKGAPAGAVRLETNPDRLVVDVPNADMTQLIDQPQSGRFTTNMRTEQLNATTARVTLDVKDVVSFTTAAEGNKLTVRLSEPTFKNIRYDAATRTVKIARDASGALRADSLTVTDDYNNRVYRLTLPGDFNAHLGYGEYAIGDGYIKRATIQNNAAGQTELVFDENLVLAYTITEDETHIYIQAMTPKEKYPRVVVIDAGHGGTDNGATGNGVVEKNVNYDVANRVAEMLEQGGVKVYRSRNTDYKVPLEDRAAFGGDVGDLFVSIHCNSAGAITAANGTETHYYPHDNDGTIGISTKKAAQIMQSQMIAAVGSNDRGTFQSDFVVIKYTKVPSVLVELGFLTNSGEAGRLGGADSRQAYVQGLYNGVMAIFEEYTPGR